MVHPAQALISRALARDVAACRSLVDLLTPVIQRQVNAAMIRQRRGSRADVLDLTQEIFRILLDDDGKILRAWNPARGAKLAGYVGLIAERRVASILLSGRRSGWAEEAVDSIDLEDAGDHFPSPEHIAIPRQVLEQLLDALRASLNYRGYEMFYWLYVEERDVEWIMERAGLSRDAVSAWRVSLQKA